MCYRFGLEHDCPCGKQLNLLYCKGQPVTRDLLRDDQLEEHKKECYTNWDNPENLGKGLLGKSCLECLISDSSPVDPLHTLKAFQVCQRLREEADRKQVKLYQAIPRQSEMLKTRVSWEDLAWVKDLIFSFRHVRALSPENKEWFVTHPGLGSEYDVLHTVVLLEDYLVRVVVDNLLPEPEDILPALLTGVWHGDLPEDERECAICCSTYNTRDGHFEHAVKTPCGHIAGYNRLTRWVSEEGHYSCPLCRGQFSEITHSFPRTTPAWLKLLAGPEPMVIYG